MEQFSLFDPGHAGDLVVTEKGMPYPTFTLTDGMRIYGELSYLHNRQRIINTARHSWSFGFGKSFPNDIFINDTVTGQTIAVVKTSFWRARVTVEFANGQIFKFLHATTLSKTARWFNEEFGNVLTTECQLFSMKQQFKVLPEQSSFKNNDYLLLMTFLSVHLVLMRRIGAFRIQD